MTRKLCICVLALLLALLFAACGDQTVRDPGTPEPAPLDGIYVSPEGTLTFGGDGSSVTLTDISDILADATGLPRGDSEGIYAFTYRGGPWRYDTAETLCITVAGQKCELTNVPGETGETVVAVVSPLGSGKSLRFVRQNG